jgi:hypothetical protein
MLGSRWYAADGFDAKTRSCMTACCHPAVRLAAIAAILVGASALAAAHDASAATTLTTTVVTSVVQMTNMPSSQSPASATCPSGSTLVGGGISLGPGQAGAVFTNGLKINGSGPGDATDVADGAGNGATNPTTWTALGGFGGQSDADDTVTSTAVCATGGPSSTAVVVATVSGTTANPALGFGPVTATCPTGMSLLGGGAMAVPVADGSLKPIATYPSDGGGNPVANGTTDPRSWSAFSRNSSAGGPTDGFTPSTTVFALCAQGTISTQVVEASTALTTATSSVAQSATAACPAGTALLSGGVAIDDGTSAAGPSQFGVHLIGDDATDASGNLVTSGGAGDWTATAHTGGIAATVGVHAFAVCASTSSGGSTTTVATTSSTSSGVTSTTVAASTTSTTGSASPSTTSTTSTTSTSRATTTTSNPATITTLAAATTTSTGAVAALGLTGAEARSSAAVGLALLGAGFMVLALGWRRRRRTPGSGPLS